VLVDYFFSVAVLEYDAAENSIVVTVFLFL
jgi:hypothetical protein